MIGETVSHYKILEEIGAPPARQKVVLTGSGSAMFTQGLIIDWIHLRGLRKNALSRRN